MENPKFHPFANCEDCSAQPDQGNTSPDRHEPPPQEHAAAPDEPDDQSSTQTPPEAQRQHVQLADFTTPERSLIRTLYLTLREIHNVSLQPQLQPANRRAMIKELLQRARWNQLVDAIRVLGQNEAGLIPVEMRKVCHDLKGGALTALAGLLDMLESAETTDNDLQLITQLAHDQGRIMRTVISDLDEE